VVFDRVTRKYYEEQSKEEWSTESDRKKEIYEERN